MLRETVVAKPERLKPKPIRSIEPRPVWPGAGHRQPSVCLAKTVRLQHERKRRESPSRWVNSPNRNGIKHVLDEKPQCSLPCSDMCALPIGPLIARVRVSVAYSLSSELSVAMVMSGLIFRYVSHRANLHPHCTKLHQLRLAVIGAVAHNSQCA